MKTLLGRCFAFAFAFAVNAYGTVVAPDAIKNQLQLANIEADIDVLSLHSYPDPTYHARSQAVAHILKIYRLKDDGGWFPQEGENVTIETIGGEVSDTGVAYSGYPRPYTGKKYRASLMRLRNEVFRVVGFGQGLLNLTPTRDFSRNRTDGSNGSGSGPFLYWDKAFFPIPYYISLPTFVNMQSTVNAIDASFKTWRDPENVRLEFLPMGCSNGTANRNDGVNTIIYFSGSWDFDHDAIAITRNFYVSGTGARAGLILDTDILINGFDHVFSTAGDSDKHDVQNIVTHEVGHFIGLGHEVPTKDSNATMYETAALGEFKKRDLAPNDILGLTQAYLGVGQKFSEFPMTAACSVERRFLSCASAHNTERNPGIWLWVAALIGAATVAGRLFTGPLLRRRTPRHCEG